MSEMPKYSFDPLDIQLLGHVMAALRNYYKDDAPYIVANSSLLQRLADDPIYVHHYDEDYWADYVYHEYEKKKANERKK